MNADRLFGLTANPPGHCNFRRSFIIVIEVFLRSSLFGYLLDGLMVNLPQYLNSRQQELDEVS
jgi:hypothetical protein